MNEPILYLLFAAALLLPGLPAAVELRKRSDAAPLEIDPDYAMDPRYLGKSFRRRIARVLAHTRAGEQVPFLARSNERARVVESLAIGSTTRIEEAVLATGDVRTGAGVHLTDVFSAGSIRVGENSVLRTVAANGTVSLDTGTRIARWVDAEAGLTIGAKCVIGHSACAGAICSVAEDVEFSRLFGNPVIIGAGCEGGVPEPAPAYERDLVCLHSIEIEAGKVVPGSIKAEGDVLIRSGARVGGSVVARGSVRVESGAAISGHIFSERDVCIGSGAMVGAPGSSKTIYASRDITLTRGVTVYGWIICEGRGITQ